MSDPEKIAVPRGVDFQTVAEEYWRVDRFDLLARDFGLRQEDLAEWHDVMKARDPAWSLMERVYQVGSSLECHEDILREWTRAEVAKRYGMPVGEVDFEIANAVKFWELSHARRDLAREADEELGADEIDLLTAFSSADGMAEEKVKKLLDAFDFKEVKDPMRRVQVAKRILSLKDYLASPHTKTAAREIIRFENTMHGLEQILGTYNNKIQELTERDPLRTSTGKDVDDLAEKAQKLDAEIRKIGEAHAKLQKALGADDIDMTTRKRIFVETVAFIQEQCRIYESDPGNVRVDGVFRAGEIDWLWDQVGDRGPQYRPDISVRLADALLPENLWDPEYVPPKLTIRVCQELRQAVEHMRKVPDDAPPLIELDDEEVASIADGMQVTVDDQGGQSEAGPMAPSYGREEQDEGEVMGVY